MLCSLHTHLSCSAVSHCMRFRPCGLVPNACLDATFRFACEIGPICVCRAAPHMIRLHSMDFCIFASADRRRRRRRHARQDTICTIISSDFKSFSSVKRPYLRKIGSTQLHRLGGPSRLRPGLTDTGTDSESPVFRIARRTQRCFAGVLPKAACLSLPFDCCRLTVDYLRD